MNASELEHLWRRQEPIELLPENIARIGATVDKIDRKFRRQIWWRDFLEIGVALTLATVIALAGQTWLRWVAVASALFVAGWFIRSRMIVRQAGEIPSVTGRLHQMIRETEIQIELLRSVLWWYLLPCAVAIFALVLDVEKSSPRKLNLSFLSFFLTVCVALFALVYWLNQRTVRQKLVPRRNNLRRALEQLSQPS